MAIKSNESDGRASCSVNVAERTGAGSVRAKQSLRAENSAKDS